MELKTPLFKKPYIELDNEQEKELFKLDKDKEIKRLKEEYVMLQNASDEVEEEKDKEIERLHSIIKEVREYINSLGWNTTIPNIQDNVWKILDKVGSDKE